MLTEEYQRRRNSFCHFRDHSGDGRTRVELEMSPEDSCWDHLGRDAACISPCPSSPSLPWPRRPQVHVSSQRSSAVASHLPLASHLPWQRLLLLGDLHHSTSRAHAFPLLHSHSISGFSFSSFSSPQAPNVAIPKALISRHVFSINTLSLRESLPSFFQPRHAACEILVP